MTVAVTRLLDQAMDQLARAGIPPHAAGAPPPASPLSAPSPHFWPRIARPSDLAALIEHTALKPETTPAGILRLCDEARALGFPGVCVNPRFVAAARQRLGAAPVRVVSVVGFPLGAHLTATKAHETRAVIDAGADHVDMVMAIGPLLAGELVAVFDDLAAVVAAAAAIPVKVILETSLLDDAQKVLACLLAARAGAAFVKTSTGFGGAGATIEDVALMRQVVGDRLGVKASGGIRDFATARALVAAGASVLGCSASVAIVAEG